MKSIFARYGIPIILVLNGGQSISILFKNFSNDWEFEHKIHSTGSAAPNVQKSQKRFRTHQILKSRRLRTILTTLENLKPKVTNTDRFQKILAKKNGVKLLSNLINGEEKTLIQLKPNGWHIVVEKNREHTNIVKANDRKYITRRKLIVVIQLLI